MLRLQQKVLCKRHSCSCHTTGKYRGSAHQDCNINYRLTDKILVIFHNLKGYDNHFIMQMIGEIANKHTYKNKKGEEKQMDINVIPNNMEKYMAFMLGKHLVFIDSLQFMSSSLDKLVSNLPNNALKYTSEEIKNDEKLKHVKQEGVYPYDYMDSFNRFSEKKLPNKDDLYSLLNDEHISDKQYVHTIKEYYKLDPCHYFTSPGLSWDAVLKMTDIKLELITDVDMFQFIEKGMCSGVFYIANRYGKANNRYMKEYDEKVPSKYTVYLDANNLCGWAMSQYLPTGCFRWLTEKEINKTDFAKCKEDSKKGLICKLIWNTHMSYVIFIMTIL